MTVALGIDPGLSGALVCVRGTEVLTCLDLPVEQGTGTRQRLSAPVLAHHLRELLTAHGPCHAALEAVAARPGNGVSSMFGFGRSLGAIEGVLAALGIPATYYTPATWKRRYGLLGCPKDASRTRALELYPGAAGWLTRKKDHGRADALLLAHLWLSGNRG